MATAFLIRFERRGDSTVMVRETYATERVETHPPSV
jgi:hypothetical protein